MSMGCVLYTLESANMVHFTIENLTKAWPQKQIKMDYKNLSIMKIQNTFPKQ